VFKQRLLGSLLCALSALLSAFLLFQLQPMVAKIILPVFGGGSSVWTTCLLFFQTGLFLGYLYAHGLVRWGNPRVQAVLHVVLLASSLVVIPVTVAAPAEINEASAVLSILQLLLISVGAPYALLASNAPLLQVWFSRLMPGGTPYRLYALSNVGSLLGLLIYPFVLEPWLPTDSQTWLWSVMYVAYVVLTAIVAFSQAGVARSPEPRSALPSEITSGEPASSLRGPLLWFLLPFCGSTLLLAMTNYVIQDLASVPLLWVLPLGLYLLSFILCFDSNRWYSRRLYGILTALLAMIAFEPQITGAWAGMGRIVAICFGALFTACMICHGELVRLKPEQARLTSFYLWLSAGGAAGGVFVSIVAPYLFTAIFELHLAMFLCGALLLILIYHDPHSSLYRGQHRRQWMALLGTAVLVAGTLVLSLWRLDAVVAAGGSVSTEAGSVLWRGRNFYGVLRVVEHKVEDGSTGRRQRRLYHGRVMHGAQWVVPGQELWPLTYFGETSGVGRALRAFRVGEPRLIGIIGLGAGTIAAYGTPRDHMRFFEIDPAVVYCARQFFTFLSQSPAQISTVLGDARRQLLRERDGSFDVLVVDAFSGDSIPVHLITAEAVALYLAKLKPGGLLLFHISSFHFDLRPVVYSIAAKLHLHVVHLAQEKQLKPGEEPNDWLLLSTDREFLLHAEVARAGVPPPPGIEKFPPWTDQFSNPLGVVWGRWSVPGA
jgi:hypothetical protein